MSHTKYQFYMHFHNSTLVYKIYFQQRPSQFACLFLVFIAAEFMAGATTKNAPDNKCLVWGQSHVIWNKKSNVHY